MLLPQIHWRPIGPRLLRLSGGVLQLPEALPVRLLSGAHASVRMDLVLRRRKRAGAHDQQGHHTCRGSRHRDDERVVDREDNDL